MNRRILLLLAIPLLLTGCESRDIDHVLGFVNDWMMAKGILDENGNPTLKAAGVATGWATTGDDAVDAAVQAGAMLDGIKKTDKLAKDATTDIKSRPPKLDDAKKKLDSAVDARPNDWSYRNQRGAVALLQGDTAAMQQDFAKAESQCAGNKRCLNALYRDRGHHLFNAQLSTSKYIDNGDGNSVFTSTCETLQAVATNKEALAGTLAGTERALLQANIDKMNADIRDGNCY